ncbi:MAG: hypothetical protein DI537_17085 [Stutzerimonas stutzeri]|nr:MAG: hypothetical protein DI537_17085 [Stutzerimonas stutzeri]
MSWLKLGQIGSESWRCKKTVPDHFIHRSALDAEIAPAEQPRPAPLGRPRHLGAGLEGADLQRNKGADLQRDLTAETTHAAARTNCTIFNQSID